MADEVAVSAEAARVADLLRQVGRLQRRASQEWATIEMTMAQMKALFVLHHDGPAKVSDVAEALGVSAPSMTGTLERLVRQGLVERRHDPSDRRLVINALTPAGQTLVERLHQGRRARLLAGLARLDPATVDSLVEGLGALLAAMEANEREGRPSDDPARAPEMMETKA